MNKQPKDKIIVISIMSYYARQIFAETKGYEFRKSPLKDCDLTICSKKSLTSKVGEDVTVTSYILKE